jgi:hypothetical protein
MDSNRVSRGLRFTASLFTLDGGTGLRFRTFLVMCHDARLGLLDHDLLLDDDDLLLLSGSVIPVGRGSRGL